MSHKFLSLLTPLLFLTSCVWGDANYLYVDTGYRWDKLDNRVILYGDTTAAGSPERFSRINSYQLGLVGKAHLCSPLFLKGAGHYGWIGSGDYHSSTFFGNIHGNTWDAKLGLGYTFCRSCWGVAPLIGWSYDELDLTVKNVHSTALITPTGPISLSDLNSKQTINGPWVGFDLLFSPTPCADFTLTYELHRASWEGKHLPRTGNFIPALGTVTGFADIRRHHRFWGNVFEIDYSTHFWCRYTLGFALKYQLWIGQGTGHYQRTITPLSALLPNRVVQNLEWQSFSATLRLGYSF